MVITYYENTKCYFWIHESHFHFGLMNLIFAFGIKESLFLIWLDERLE